MEREGSSGLGMHLAPGESQLLLRRQDLRLSSSLCIRTACCHNPGMGDGRGKVVWASKDTVWSPLFESLISF